MDKLQINPPEGYEIDQDKSDLTKGVVHFKERKKVLTYEDVATELFCTENKPDHYDYDSNNDYDSYITSLVASSGWTNNKLTGINLLSTTKEQLESILALNKLCNVAKYLNDGWLPTFNHNCYVINTPAHKEPVEIRVTLTEIAGGYGIKYSSVYFKSKELAQQAIEILGESVIRQALTLNH